MNRTYFILGNVIVASLSIDLDKAERVLNKAWDAIGNAAIHPPSQIANQIDAVAGAKDLTFKYILATGILGKCTEPKIHPRALQTSSKLKRSYDARSLCHKVIVPFEKTKGDLWGLSNEPFVNKPARHPEHSKDNKQLQNKELAENLHNVLEFAHKASENEVFAMLVYVLRLGKRRADSHITVSVDVETTYRRLVEFVEKFLQESDRGSRLAAVVGALVTLLNENYVVKVHPPNASDHFAKTAGDVEIHHARKVISAFECKDRAINLDDVHHGIRKAMDMGISEYNFVAGAGLAVGQEESIRQTILTSASLDLHLIEIQEVTTAWAAALNPIRRNRIGEVIVRILRDDMRRSEVANIAAELWNSLK